MHGHDLYSFLNGSSPKPPKTVTKDDKEIVNPDYRVWFRQDQLIQNALMASVDAPIASQVATAATSKKAWDSLHMSFANKSQTRIFSLRDMLGKISRDSKSIADYLREIKTISDELATAGSPISNEELIVKILSGLGPEYREISVAIRARDSPIAYEELYDKLIDHEIVLKHEELKKSSTSITAAVAQRSNSSVLANRTNKRWNTSSTPWRPQQTQRSQYPFHTNPSQQWRPFQSNILSSRVQCQLCEKFGHTARLCRSRSHNHMEAKANFVSKSASFSIPWILDTGASHHVTSDSRNLQQSQDYTGPEEISMGDGSEYGSSIGVRPE